MRQTLFHRKVDYLYNVPNYFLQVSESTSDEDSDENNVDYKKLLLSLVNDNKDMKNIIFEQQKQIGELLPKIGNTINNTTNNMTKNKFNINVSPIK